jgi:hypothetical protein
MSKENHSSRNPKLTLLKLPELKVKNYNTNNNFQNDLSPTIFHTKEHNLSFVLSTNEEINNSTNDISIKPTLTKNYISSSLNNSINETNRTHKSFNTPILKRRSKNIISNHESPNFKRINKSNFHKKVRFDFFGNEINHKNKKNVKVTFIDQINEDKTFTDIIDVESIKQYIKVYGKINRKDTYVRDANCSCSCFLF